MIDVCDLTKTYGGIEAIQSLNFQIRKGEVVGFLGPNGAGKSTTMKIITGFMAPTSGKAMVCGFDVFENPIEVKKRIGYLPETPPVYSDMTVESYLRYVAELKLVEKQKISKQVDHAIEKTNLGNVKKRMIQNLSKGFRQRVGIAQALVSDPEVLILDEPTVGLDPKQVAEIRDLIQELRGQHTIILSTHILPEVQATCERIIIISKGRIVAQDTLENLTHIKQGVQKVSLKIRKSASQSPQSQNILQKIPGILKVQNMSHEISPEAPQVWTLETTAGDEIIETIAQQVISSGLGLLEISAVKADLEDVFLQLTYGNQGGGL